MVKIRLRRTGRKNESRFRIVVTDSRASRDGEYLECLGWYDPTLPEKNFTLAVDRVEHWLTRGAVLTESVRVLLRKARRVSAGM